MRGLNVKCCLLSKIKRDADEYTTEVTGSFYVLKNPDYPPWQPYPNNPEGRYNGPCTGSLYLGDTLDTCIKEVGRIGKVAYKVVVDDMKAKKILDLESWCLVNPTYSGSLLIHSASNGWEPTREIGDWAYEKGYCGIRFLSQHGNNHINLLLYRDKINVQEGFFTRVDL